MWVIAGVSMENLRGSGALAAARQRSASGTAKAVAFRNAQSHRNYTAHGSQVTNK